MIFHVSRTLDNLLDVTFQTSNGPLFIGGVKEEDLDKTVLSMADSGLTQILVPYYEWLEMGRPDHLKRDIQCH